MKKLTLLLLIALTASLQSSFADGCLPGEPCYYEEEKTSPKVEPVADVKQNVFYVTLGGGYTFVEKDEEILGHQVYDLRLDAYHFAPHWSAEVGFGIMPDIRNRQHPGEGRFFLPDDTEGVRFTADLLYHFDANGANELVDPYTAIGAGINLYDDDLAEGDDAVYGALGVGAFINFSDDWFLKPDYKVMMVGEDTEVNQQVTVALGYKFCLN